MTDYCDGDTCTVRPPGEMVTGFYAVPIVCLDGDPTAMCPYCLTVCDEKYQCRHYGGTRWKDAVFFEVVQG